MNRVTSKILITAIVAVSIAFPTKATIESKTIVVETPSDLPELAQGPAEAMYLHYTHEAQAILYLDWDHGRKLAILDVTDPANIKSGEISIEAQAAYDFVKYLGAGRTLIHYRDHSGFAVLNFNNYKTPAPDLRCD